MHFKRRGRLWHILPWPSPALTGTMCSAVQCYAVLCPHLVGNLAADGGVLQPRVGVQVLVQLAVIGAAWQAAHPQVDGKAAVAGVGHRVQQHRVAPFLHEQVRGAGK